MLRLPCHADRGGRLRCLAVACGQVQAVCRQVMQLPARVPCLTNLLSGSSPGNAACQPHAVSVWGQPALSTFEQHGQCQPCKPVHSPSPLASNTLRATCTRKYAYGRFPAPAAACAVDAVVACCPASDEATPHVVHTQHLLVASASAFDHMPCSREQTVTTSRWRRGPSASLKTNLSARLS
ncbi:hypothetical protein COO60DRAFT_562178 [Scenedesmus sp. NREL 46B-D3]|nr:hypothetical protein COO60DRAFT_562178 [Scenedesmus sp. NREL 46B-D3]